MHLVPDLTRSVLVTFEAITNWSCGLVLANGEIHTTKRNRPQHAVENQRANYRNLTFATIVN